MPLGANWAAVVLQLGRCSYNWWMCQNSMLHAVNATSGGGTGSGLKIQIENAHYLYCMLGESSASGAAADGEQPV